MLAKEGKPPKALLSRPVLAPELFDIWNAFEELLTDRPIGFSQGMIPWSAIDRWARREGLEDEAYERFRRLIRAMEAAREEEMEKRQPKPSGADQK